MSSTNRRRECQICKETEDVTGTYCPKCRRTLRQIKEAHALGSKRRPALCRYERPVKVH